MPVRFSTWLEARAPFLFKEVMPVWLTMLASLLAGIAAAFGTYYLAPAINRQYQVDEARSIHISETTKSLNEQIIALSQKVRRLNDSLANKSEDAAEERQDCLDLTTKLQWMLVDLRVVLKGDDDKAAIKKLAEAIEGVTRVLEVAVDDGSEPRLLTAMRTLGERTRDVLDRLYRVASLK